jgi:hypothetical protein
MKKEKTPEELKKEGRKLKRRVDKGVKVRGKKVIEKKKTSKSKTKTVTQEGKPTKVKKVKKVMLSRAEMSRIERKSTAIGGAIGTVLGASLLPKYEPGSTKTKSRLKGGGLGAAAGMVGGQFVSSFKNKKRVKTKTVGGVNKKAAKKVVKGKMKTMRQKRRR